MKKYFIFVLIVLMLFTTGCTTDDDNDPSKKDPIIDNKKEEEDNKEVNVKMLERLNPEYYVPGEALIDDAHVVYINFDGFAWYYFDEARKLGLVPNLESFMKEGITFNNLRNTLPSITNPCQNQILSGSTSEVTKNVYRYYDISTNTVIQQQRENASDTIISQAVKDKISIVDVRHYLGENFLTGYDTSKLYVVSDMKDPDVLNHSEDEDYFARFSQLIKIVKGETFRNNSYTLKVDKLPTIMILYCDDLDAVGHNESAYYGFSRALTEEDRMKNVLTRLNQMDTKLGEFIDACKEKGVYDDMTFFLTTDHGMTPFGYSSSSDTSDCGRSKLGALQSAIRKISPAYNLELVAAGKQPAKSTTVVGVGANLNIQLTFKKGITDEELDSMKETLLKEPYVGTVLTRNELKDIGYWSGANVDMLISPKGRYCFSNNMLGSYLVRGQHDSLEEAANHVYGVIWGKGIKKGYVYEKSAYNFDFGTTICASVGMVLEKANGNVLDIFDIKEE